MVDEKSERAADSNVSPYLLLPLRTLKEAEEAKDVSGLSMDIDADTTDLPRDAVSRGSRSRS